MKPEKSLLEEKMDQILANETGHRPMHLFCDICKLSALHERAAKMPEKGDQPPSGSREIELLRVSREAEDKALKNDDPFLDERAEINNIIIDIRKKNNGNDTPLTEKLLKNSQSVVLVVRKSDLVDRKKVYKLKGVDLKDRKVVVGSKLVKFDDKLKTAGQRSASALGTGFFFQEKYIITAAHVLFPPFLHLPLSEIRFVKGFSFRKEKFEGRDRHTFNNMITIRKSDVFKPVERILEAKKDYELSNNGADWAVVEVEPENGWSFDKLSNHYSLDKDDLWTGPLEGRDVYGLGHGFGLPLKLSPCGEILNVKQFNNDNSRVFNCTLDFFSGNSGSPIFDSNTHKLLGFLVRGQRDLYFSNDSKATIVPGVEANGTVGEECQKMDFLDEWKKQHMAGRGNGSGEAKETEIPQQGIIPYTRLESAGNGTYHLFICIANQARKVRFPAYPFKRDATTLIECYLEPGDPNADAGFSAGRYAIHGPADPADTPESIEIRVLDTETFITHYSILDYQDFFPLEHPEQEENIRRDRLYWASCLPEHFYEKESERVVGISLGYFEDEATFLRSAITPFPVEGLDESALKFTAQGKPVEQTARPDKAPDPADKILVISSSVQFGNIRKDTSIGGRNPKPTRFVNIEDVVVGSTLA